MSSAVPEGWKIYPLEKAVNQLIDFRGRTPKKLNMDWGNGNIRALSANNVQMGKVNFDKECYLASNALYTKWMTKGNTEKDDILFTMEAPLGNVALVPDDRKYILSQRVILLKVNKNKVTSHFFYQHLRSGHFQRLLQENATGTTALGIPQKRLVKLDVLIPPLPEQQKIAKILTSVDDVIEKTQAQIDKLKDLKTGMMQELLTKGIGHTEFKDSTVGRIPVEWTLTTLANLSTAHITKGGTPTTYGFSWVEKGVLFLRSECIKSEGISLSGSMCISEDAHESMQRSKVIGDDILISITGYIGKVCVFPEGLIEANINQHIARIRIENNLVRRFVIQYINTNAQLQRFLSIQTGQAYPQLSLKQVQETIVPIANESEMKIIVESLESVDNRLQISNTKLTKYRNLKKGLMQDLLTGKVRVKVDS